jgi:hypothetical protein
MRTKTLSGILLWLVLSLILPSATPAAVVGRLTQVEGQVDLLKKGQLPAIPLKPNDGVETGDVVRTKSLSKAQITFIDDTVLTISPGSRIAIEKYMVAGGKRNAVLKMFQGVALAVVSKIFKAKEPDFVVKTNTAIMGVRGTKVGLLLYPNYSEILTFEGRTEVRNLFLEIPGVIELKGGHGTRVTRGLPPTMAFVVSHGDFERFMHYLTTGLTARVRGQDSNPGSSGSGDQLARGSSGSGEIMLVSIVPKVKPPEQKKPDVETVQTVVEEETPTPPAPPPPPSPPPSPSESYKTLQYEYNGQYQMSFSEGHQLATYTGLITFPSANVQAEFTIEALDPSTPGNFAKDSSGGIQWNLSGTLSRTDANEPYTGTLTATGNTQGGTIFTFTLAASYDEVNNKLTLTSVGPVSGGYVSTPVWGYDFTSPGESNKVTQGSATISWNVGPIPAPAPTPEPEPEPAPALPNTYPVQMVFNNGQYTMKFEQGHQDAIFTGSLILKNSQVNFTVVADDPASPGNFVKSSSGKITWQVSGVLDLSPDGTSYSGTLIAKGTTAGGTVFTFPLKATYENGKLTFDPISQVTGTYALDTTTAATCDFTSPGGSNKITQGLATISWTLSDTATATPTSTTTAASGSTPTSATPISTTATVSTGIAATSVTAPAVTQNSATSTLSPAVSMDAAVVSSALTPLPLPSTLSTAGPPGQAAAGPPGQAVSAMAPGHAVAAGPPGQAVSAAAPGQAAASAVGPGAAVTPSGVAAPGLQALSPAASPAALTPVAPPVATPVVTPSGVAPPGLQNQPAALNNVHIPPGLSKAPGQAGEPPGNANGHYK